jgi:hypothetical protein
VQFGSRLHLICIRPGGPTRYIHRGFPTKADLIRVALDQCIAEDLAPTIEVVRRSDDPLSDLAQPIEAAISLGARAHNLLTAVQGGVADSQSMNGSRCLRRRPFVLHPSRAAGQCQGFWGSRAERGAGQSRRHPQLFIGS